VSFGVIPAWKKTFRPTERGRLETHRRGLPAQQGKLAIRGGRVCRMLPFDKRRVGEVGQEQARHFRAGGAIASKRSAVARIELARALAAAIAALIVVAGLSRGGAPVAPPPGHRLAVAPFVAQRPLGQAMPHNGGYAHRGAHLRHAQLRNRLTGLSAS
jgi:hypothetical protein